MCIQVSNYISPRSARLIYYIELCVLLFERGVIIELNDTENGIDFLKYKHTTHNTMNFSSCVDKIRNLFLENLFLNLESNLIL